MRLSLVLAILFLVSLPNGAFGLGSMAIIAASYGENGPVFCGLSSDGSNLVSCFGADASIVYGAPLNIPLIGLTAGNGFVCGLLLDTNQPYYWGSNLYVKMGVPQPMVGGVAYSKFSAGDDHLCALRIRPKGTRVARAGMSVIECWGYNMTATHIIAGTISAISSGSMFNCGLFKQNRTVFYWGDDARSGVIELAPKNVRFQSISAGGFHVCGVLENAHVFCWGRRLEMRQSVSSDSLDNGDVNTVLVDPLVSVVGGRFHACGIKSLDHHVICWGFTLQNNVPTPKEVRMFAIAAGDYFTCGVLAGTPLLPECWGTGGPWSMPIAVSPGICASTPCSQGYYEVTNKDGMGNSRKCNPGDWRVCLPCSATCPEGLYQSSPCNTTADRSCQFNCSSCVSEDCVSFCSPQSQPEDQKFMAFQSPIFIIEVVFAVIFVSTVLLFAYLYIQHKLQHCRCSHKELSLVKSTTNSCRKETSSIQSDMDDLKIRRAQVFSYEELKQATSGFCERSQVGKGGSSRVFKGILRDGTMVAIKHVIKASNINKSTKELFHTELNVLSRLNHAHLLKLLGYCDENGERLLVYEFMAHGSLHQHLHGKDPSMKKQLDWVRRVTIAVQAARGIQYLHCYACPPVIHRDIKSSNILIDEEDNAHVADFGLALLGPTDSVSPLSELPAGTLGYIDPEYFRLHYLTTKSDIYSFGVLLLEILSGRKAIDVQFSEENIVHWAVPLIKAGNISSVLDPVLPPPSDLQALVKIASMACKCVSMHGKDRPSMNTVATTLEKALALLVGSPCGEQLILPMEVDLGSSRIQKKDLLTSSNQPCLERIDCRAPSWIRFPIVTSSQKGKSLVSEADMDDRATVEGRNLGSSSRDGLRSLEEEIVPASPE